MRTTILVQINSLLAYYKLRSKLSFALRRSRCSSKQMMQMLSKAPLFLCVSNVDHRLLISTSEDHNVLPDVMISNLKRREEKMCLTILI